MVVENKYGFFELEKKPTVTELSEYYGKKYYQEEKLYSHTYSPEELEYTHNKITQKHFAFKELLADNIQLKLLDIGCGEGFCLKHFKDLGWDVTGCDFSEFGLKTHNPDCIGNVLVGDIYEQLAALIKADRKFDVIWLDNILEHVLEPLELLGLCKQLSKEKGVLIIEVPNDFSRLQTHLYNNKIIDKQFWVAIPDHISYFNKAGLANICREAGWQSLRFLSDFPIDFNLANKEANYVMDRTKGKAAHQQRVLLDNLFHTISIEDTNKLYEALADLGMGRQIIGIFSNI